MPPGHDAWIAGDKRCVLIDFTGVGEVRKTGLISARPAAFASPDNSC